MLNVVGGILIKYLLVVSRDPCAHDCTSIAWIYRNLVYLPYDYKAHNEQFMDPGDKVHQCENMHYTRTFSVNTGLTYS